MSHYHSLLFMLVCHIIVMASLLWGIAMLMHWAGLLHV